MRAFVRPQAIDSQHRSERDSEQTLDGVDIVFGTAHEKGIAGPLGEGGRQPGATPTDRVMEERRGYAVVALEPGKLSQYVLGANPMAARTG
jgi:hypothetical protein